MHPLPSYPLPWKFGSEKQHLSVDSAGGEVPGIGKSTVAQQSVHIMQTWAGLLCSTLSFKEAQAGLIMCRYDFVLLLNYIHVLKPVVNMSLTGSSNQRAENLSFMSPSTKLHLQRHLYGTFFCFSTV